MEDIEEVSRGYRRGSRTLLNAVDERVGRLESEDDEVLLMLGALGQWRRQKAVSERGLFV